MEEKKLYFSVSFTLQQGKKKKAKQLNKNNRKQKNPKQFNSASTIFCLSSQLSLYWS